MRTLLLFICCNFSLALWSQDNCNAYRLQGDSCRYKACSYLEKAPRYFQLTKEYHKIKDSAITICPDYAVAYRNKSTAYLKTGDFLNWKKLIDKAVALNPEEHLSYRAWCRFQFFRDYKGAIKDIEALDSMITYDIGYCQNGNYHLNMVKGLCYKMLGKETQAIEIITSQMKKDSSSIGLFDYLHLGVLYLQTKQYDKAIDAFEKQAEVNPLAENSYYKAMTYQHLDNSAEYKALLNKAKLQYTSGNKMFDPYTHQIDKVYLSEIEKRIGSSF